jgi:hypothetical protein
MLDDEETFAGFAASDEEFERLGFCVKVYVSDGGLQFGLRIEASEVRFLGLRLDVKDLGGREPALGGQVESNSISELMDGLGLISSETVEHMLEIDNGREEPAILEHLRLHFQ